MKDQYFGDVNDYRKYGLLRCFASAGFSLGIDWMKTAAVGTRQGGRIPYLRDPGAGATAMRICSPSSAGAWRMAGAG